MKQGKKNITLLHLAIPLNSGTSALEAAEKKYYNENNNELIIIIKR